MGHLRQTILNSENKKRGSLEQDKLKSSFYFKNLNIIKLANTVRPWRLWMFPKNYRVLKQLWENKRKQKVFWKIYAAH